MVDRFPATPSPNTSVQASPAGPAHQEGKDKDSAALGSERPPSPTLKHGALQRTQQPQGQGQAARTETLKAISVALDNGQVAVGDYRSLGQTNRALRHKLETDQTTRAVLFRRQDLSFPDPAKTDGALKLSMGPGQDHLLYETGDEKGPARHFPSQFLNTSRTMLLAKSDGLYQRDFFGGQPRQISTIPPHSDNTTIYGDRFATVEAQFLASPDAAGFTLTPPRIIDLQSGQTIELDHDDIQFDKQALENHAPEEIEYFVLGGATEGSRKAVIFDAKSGAQKAAVTHDQDITSALLSRDNSFLVTSSETTDRDRVIKITRLETDQTIEQTFPLGVFNEDIKLSPDGKQMALCMSEMHMSVIPLDGGVPKLIPCHTGIESEFSFSRDSASLLITPAGGETSIHDIASGLTSGPLAGASTITKEKDCILTVDPMSDQQVKIQFLDLIAKTQIELYHSKESGNSVFFTSEDAHRVAAVDYQPDPHGPVGSTALTLSLYDMAHQHSLGSVQLTAPVSRLEFSPGGQAIAFQQGQKDRVQFIHFESHQYSEIQHNGEIHEIAFSDDGSLIATASDDGETRIVSIRDSKMVKAIQHEAPVTDIRFSSDGKLVLTSSIDKSALSNASAARQKEMVSSLYR
ncbi:WD40 repeat domain-containing protein [Aestuariispira insulae]|uniref:Serine-threonine kinase receptor-associated protein n=1 Tax=Aestuariispira insulae TaxID=1461337 RepID=A0A3D9H2I0_9PROT|nr:WD40 repeat domain-containing protein [Aestuariispira insulae]RED43727.1 WD40 repeat protein [Aestuariispira insulae]